MHTFFREMNTDQASVSRRTLGHTCRQRCAYRFDQGFQSPLCQSVGVLVIITVFIAIGSLLIGSNLDLDDFVDPHTNHSDVSLLVAEATWLTWVFIADPGTHADEVGRLRLPSAVVTVFGIVLSAMVIGLIVDGIKKKMDDLERGRGRVTEAGHILLLGWTEKTVQVINQLALMMESERGGTILVVSDQNKKEAEAELRERCSLRGSRLVVRTGNMMAQSDLLKFSCHLARAIIILAPDGAPDKADAQVLRTVLSMRGIELNYGLTGHIVAEMRDIDNTSLVDLVGAESVETVVSHDVVGRLMIQAARMRGLAEVYSCLLGFDGDEIYTKCWPQFTGRTFDQVVRSFDTAVPIGISIPATAPGERDRVVLNPAGDYVMGRHDAVVVIAEDDDAYAPTEEVRRKPLACPSLPRWNNHSVKENILMTGWRRDLDDVIVLLDELVSPGSQLHMLSELSEEERERRLRDGGLDPECDLKNLQLVHHVGNPAVRRQLKALRNPPLSEFDSVLVLADEALEEDMMHSDSNCLAILLLVRDLQLKDSKFHNRQTANARRMSSMVVEAMQSSLTLKRGSAGAALGAAAAAASKGVDAEAAADNAAMKMLRKMSKKRDAATVAAGGPAATAAAGRRTLDQYIGSDGGGAGRRVPIPPPPPGSAPGTGAASSDAADTLGEMKTSAGRGGRAPIGAQGNATNRVQTEIDPSALEDSMDQHAQRLQVTHTKSTHSAKRKFLKKLKSRSTLPSSGKRGPSDTFRLQRSCLVTCEILDPQTHMIIMDNKVRGGNARVCCVCALCVCVLCCVGLD